MTDDDERRDVMIKTKGARRRAAMRRVLKLSEPMIEELERHMDHLARVAVMASDHADEPLTWRWTSNDADNVPIPLSSLDWSGVELANDLADEQRGGMPTPISLLAFGDMPLTAISGATATLGAALHTETWDPHLVMSVLNAGTELIGNYRRGQQLGYPTYVLVELVGAIGVYAQGITGVLL